jgi:hypothetical protein
MTPKRYAYLDHGLVSIDGCGQFSGFDLDDVISSLTTLRDRMNQGQDVSQITMNRLAGWPELETEPF